jgi:hypothetical protein
MGGGLLFLYQLLPKLSLGLGPRIGFDDITSEANQSFQAGLAHLQFAASGKVSFTAAAGAELREFQSNAEAEKVTPILKASAFYHPFHHHRARWLSPSHRLKRPARNRLYGFGGHTIHQTALFPGGLRFRERRL